MIKINLASLKQSSLASESFSARSEPAEIGKTRIFSLSELKGLPLRQVLVPVVLGVVLTVILQTVKEEELGKLDRRIEKLTKESERLQQEYTKTKKYEDLQKELDAEETTIRRKLDTVKRLIEDRSTPPKLFLSLSKAIPEEVWLSELSIQGAELSLKGTSLDFGQISDFMKNLNESIYFQDLKLKSTQQVRDENGLEMATFELGARRRSE